MQPDPLQQLRDVHVPQAPSWWPPAPGWWLLAAILLGAAAWLGLRLWRHLQAQKPFRSAQRLHQQLCSDLAQQRITNEQYLHEANALLKRAFVHALGERQSAALTGTEWLSYLNQFVDGDAFSNSAGKLLTESRFAPGRQLDPALITTLQQQVATALARAARQ